MNALVTGASRGLGWAISQRLASHGWSVCINARSRGVLEARLPELPIVADRQKHTVWAADLGNPATKLRLPGTVDTLVCAAGVSSSVLVAAESSSNIERTLRINLYAPIALSRDMTRSLLHRRAPGNIIYISSILAHRGQPGSAVYGATTAGLEAFARALAREVGSRGIRVNSVAPGLADTDMGRATPDWLMANNVLPGLIPPEAVANAVEYCISNAHITGQTIIVDNGNLA